MSFLINTLDLSVLMSVILFLVGRELKIFLVLLPLVLFLMLTVIVIGRIGIGGAASYYQILSDKLLGTERLYDRGEEKPYSYGVFASQGGEGYWTVDISGRFKGFENKDGYVYMKVYVPHGFGGIYIYINAISWENKTSFTYNVSDLDYADQEYRFKKISSIKDLIKKNSHVIVRTIVLVDSGYINSCTDKDKYICNRLYEVYIREMAGNTSLDGYIFQKKKVGFNSFSNITVGPLIQVEAYKSEK